MSAAQTHGSLAAGDLLAAARAGDGDGDAFQALVSPHLHLHAYRMLGSLDDADDAVQDVLLTAWRALSAYEGTAPLLHWLYRITTTSSLKIIRAKGRRPVPADGRLDTIRLVPTRANGHPALAAYLPGTSARCQGYGIMVFTTTGDSIATITGFPSPDLFGRFGLPPACD